MTDQEPVRPIEELPREAEELGAEAAEQAKGGSFTDRDKFHDYLGYEGGSYGASYGWADFIRDVT